MKSGLYSCASVPVHIIGAPNSTSAVHVAIDSTFSPTTWLLSRFFFDVIPLRVIPTIVVSTTYAKLCLLGTPHYLQEYRVYWMAGLSPDAANFFKFLFILVLFAAAMTLFVSSQHCGCHKSLIVCERRISYWPASSKMVELQFFYRRCSTCSS